jgi:hypothetical protein
MERLDSTALVHRRLRIFLPPSPIPLVPSYLYPGASVPSEIHANLQKFYSFWTSRLCVGTLYMLRVPKTPTHLKLTQRIHRQRTSTSVTGTEALYRPARPNSTAKYHFASRRHAHEDLRSQPPPVPVTTPLDLPMAMVRSQ